MGADDNEVAPEPWVAAPPEPPAGAPKDLGFLSDKAPLMYLGAFGYACSCCFCVAPPLVQMGL